jgi:nicotinamidase-related amidase
MLFYRVFAKGRKGKAMLIERERSCLLVVDVQEKLASAVSEPAAVVRNCGILLQAAARLEVPTLLSEQYPQGLGHTVPELRSLAPESARLPKLSFSCAADPGLRARLQDMRRSQVVVCGLEAHVCVLQTALGLKGDGREVFVVADAIASRAPANREMALRRLAENGVELVTTEMVVFEWLGQAGTPEFKELSRLIK